MEIDDVIAPIVAEVPVVQVEEREALELQHHLAR